MKAPLHPARARALAIAYLVERGDVVIGPDVSPGIALQLQRAGMSRATAYRWARDFAHWLEVGKP